MSKRQRPDQLHTETLLSKYESHQNTPQGGHWTESELLELIDYFEQEYLLEQALEICDLGLERFPYSHEFYVQRSRILILNGQEATAMLHLDEAELISPDAIDVLLLRAEALRALALYSEAHQLLEQLKLKHTHKALSDIFFIEALVFEREENYEQMYFALEASLEADSTNVDALHRVWQVAQTCRRHLECMDLLERILEENAYSYQAWHQLGNGWAYLGQYENALEAFDFATVIQDDFWPAWQDRADLCYELQQYAQALPFYRKLETRAQDDPELDLRLAQCLFHTQQVDEAKVYLLKAIRTEPLNDEVFFYYGECLAYQQQYRSAIKAYKRALDLDCLREEYHAALAECYFDLQEWVLAENHFLMATELAPESVQYWLQYATFLMETDRCAYALEVLEEAEHSTTGIELAYCQVACLFLLGRRKAAFNQLHLALHENHELHPVLFDLAPQLREDRQVLAAIAAFQP